MKFMVKPLVPVNVTPFAMAAGGACATLTCSLDCNLDGPCDLVCGLRIIKPAQPAAN